jgi:hypothetical protein
MMRVLTWFRAVLAVNFGLCCDLRRGRRFGTCVAGPHRGAAILEESGPT